MFHLARILIPAPPASDITGPALTHALHLAAYAQTELHLVQVDLPDDSDAPLPPARIREDVLAYARQMTLPVPADALTLHVARVAAPSIADGLLAYTNADAETRDLIVADYEDPAPAPVLADPRAARLVDQAPCPVFTVTNPRHNIPKRILAPVDFSPHAQTALAHAKILATYYGATLYALHVIENPQYVALNSTDMLALSDATLPERKALRRLEAFVDDTGGPDLSVRLHVMHGAAAEHIGAFAADHDIDLLVLASHGVLARHTHPLGNVARKTLRRLALSTFLVKAFGCSLTPTRTSRDASQRSSFPDASSSES